MLTRRPSLRERYKQSLSKRLCNSNLSSLPHLQTHGLVTGQIQTNKFAADIEIYFSSCQFKFVAPTVFCSEPWLRNDMHWHCCQINDSTKHGLCWVYPEEWKRAHRNKSQTKTIEEGSEWLLNNVTDLLEKHWVGHRLGIKYWKKEWPQWFHADVGTAQYLHEMRTLGTPSNWQT